MLDRFIPREDFASYEDFRRNFSIRVPERFNFALDVVDDIARREPDRPALVWCDDHGNTARFSFGDLARMSDKAANVFRAAGIGKGDPVMLILKRRYEFWFCLLGLHKLGAVAIPATHLLRVKDLVYRNRAAGVRMIVAVNDPELVGHVEEAAAESPTLAVKALVGARRVSHQAEESGQRSSTDNRMSQQAEESGQRSSTDNRMSHQVEKSVTREGWLDFDDALAAAAEAFVPPTGDAAPANDDTALLYFTSGTTGMPKMVRHDFAYPLGHILTARYWQNVRPGGLHLTVADTGWAKSVWGKIYGQWLAGAAVFVYDMDKFVPKRLLEVIAAHRLTSFCAPPTIFRYLIKEDLASYDLGSLEECAVAGEPLNPEVYHQWHQATGLKLREGYGQTESVVLVATWPWVEPKPGSMGLPSPGWEVDIVDDAGRPCEAGEEGQIVIRTGAGKPVGMFNGYHRDPELTARVWHDGVYYTGDVAWRDEDGYYWFVGRSDDVIKSSGYRIGPFEVESALLEHPAVLECAVTGVPDPVRGQVVKATVVLAGGFAPGPPLEKELQEHVKKVTAPYKYPRVVEFVAELPKTISGKIRRVAIRDRDSRVE